MDTASRLSATQALLAPYAVPVGGRDGRAHDEPADDTRFPFQRDRDRIIHSQAFRRLQGKTQVFVAGEGDHYRTRLTHTMEVAQIARDIARTLRLNEDLTECIALAHDLGHPPFGHSGEETLNVLMEKYDLRFEHNQQSARIVTLLEEHSAHQPGLNLNREVLDGLAKHTTLVRAPSLEARVADVADQIAYTAHDCDDGLRAHLFSLENVRVVSLAREAAEHASRRGTSFRGALIHLLVSDLYAESEQRLRAKTIQSIDDVYATREPLIAFSAHMQDQLQVLRSFLWQHMYLHPTVQLATEEGQAILEQLWAKYEATPTDKIQQLQRRTSSTLPEAIKDYIAGMTDAYAREQAG